ncbi:MAG: dynamin family protein [Streptosporangiaceae bacterium]
MIGDIAGLAEPPSGGGCIAAAAAGQRPVLPSAVTPLTSLATAVRYGRDEGVTAVFRDGLAESYPLSALDDLVTERGNPGNRRGLASVTVAVDAPVLARGVELVDTPGTGSVYSLNPQPFRDHLRLWIPDRHVPVSQQIAHGGT